MQNEISQLLNDLFPQTLGVPDPMPILLFWLIAPGGIMFAILYFGREFLRPRWRGYWDAV